MSANVALARGKLGVYPPTVLQRQRPVFDAPLRAPASWLAKKWGLGKSHRLAPSYTAVVSS